MGLLDGALDALGLSPDFGPAIDQAQFDPVDVQSLFGTTSYEDGKLSASLSPDFQSIVNMLMGDLSGLDEAGMLDMMRQQAAPYEEQQRLGMENRLFKQGRLGHSQVYQPGGAMRSLFDAQANADLMRQLQAGDVVAQRRRNILGDIQGIEGQLFNYSLPFTQARTTANTNVSNLMASSASFMPNLLGSMISGGIQGYATGSAMR